MAWTSSGSILLSSDWQYTEPIPSGSFFRFKHTEAHNGGLFAVAQCEVDSSGKLSLIDSQILVVEKPISDVIRLPLPGCFSERRIAIKKLPKQPSLQQELKRLILPGFLQPTEEEIRIVSRSNWRVDIEISDFVETIAPTEPEVITPPPNSTTKVLTYASNGDTNGVCYWIGTNYGIEACTNPHTARRVTVSFSSFLNEAHNQPAALVDRVPNAQVATANQADSWMMLDLGTNNSLACNYYSLRGRDDAGEQPRSWKLQGSNNNSDWIDLDTEINNSAINQSTWLSESITSSNNYRYFRILQTGVNSNSTNYLTLGEWEFYGTLTHTN